MRVIQHCVVIAALLLSVAWAAPQGTDDHEGHDHGPHTAEHHHHLHHGQDEAHPQHEGKDGYILSQPNAEFAFALYKKLSATADLQPINIIFSPLSISMALSMLALGAKGETFTQLYEGLGYPKLPAATVNEAYEHILHMLDHNQGNMTLDGSNAVAIMEGAKVLDKFLEDAKHYYESEVMSVDFSKPEVAVQEINKYIAKNTNNTITDMVKEVDEDTIMMLINCVYFRGEWMEYFNLNATKKGDFKVDSNTKVSVDMMQNTGTGIYGYYEDKENFTTVLSLPYKCNGSMIIVMPDEGKMKEVEDDISFPQFKHWMQSMHSGRVMVRMPKYSISAQFSLKDTLESMGIVIPFTDQADFTGMTDTPVKVSKVEHQAVLKVDERGTEAAAGTAVGVVPVSLPPSFVVDRPFFVFITDNNSRSIVFMGKIVNPTDM